MRASDSLATRQMNWFLRYYLHYKRSYLNCKGFFLRGGYLLEFALLLFYRQWTRTENDEKGIIWMEKGTRRLYAARRLFSIRYTCLLDRSYLCDAAACLLLAGSFYLTISPGELITNSIHHHHFLLNRSLFYNKFFSVWSSFFRNIFIRSSDKTVLFNQWRIQDFVQGDGIF